MGNVTERLAEAFPNKIVLNSIGNNDVWQHNNAPRTDEKEAYYTDMWNVWFEGNAKNNATLAQNKTIEESFKKGGYYAYTIPGKNFTVISLNAMYPFVENHNDVEMSTTMLDWFEAYLQNSTEKFMIMMHVYPGNNFHEELEVFWNSTYLDRLHDILYTYRRRFVVSFGAHIHKTHYFAPESYVHPELNFVQIVNAAVSPCYNNNPSYGILEFNDNLTIKSHTSRFFQLTEY
jgi:hypothetical protein